MNDSQLECYRGREFEETGVHQNAHYLDLARARAGLRSDYQLAKQLGVTRQFVSKLRADSIPIPEPVADRLGELCGIDGAVVYAETQAARAKRTDVRAFWERVARSLAASLVLVCVGLFAPAHDAAALGTASASAARAIHYAKSWLRRWARRLAWPRAVVYSFAYQ